MTAGPGTVLDVEPPRGGGVDGEVTTVDVLGVGVSAVQLDQLIADIERALDGRSRLNMTFANPNYLMAAARDERLRAAINGFDRVLPDGWGVVLASRLLGRRIPRRLANDDIAVPLFAMLAKRRARVFLLGSAPGVAEQAAARLRAAFPGLGVAGTLHGWLDVEEGTPGRFSPQAVDRMVDAVNAACPDVLVVGLPTPKQQRFVVENRVRLQAPVVMTGGAWIDHLAERIRYYPALVLRLRLCWAYRWAREPRRLAYRYTVELAHFALRVLGQRRAERRPEIAAAD